MSNQLDGSMFFFDKSNLSDRYTVLANKVRAARSKITKTENNLSDFMKQWNAKEVTSVKQQKSIKALAYVDLEVLHELVKELGGIYHEIKNLAHLREPLPADDPDLDLAINHEVMANAINVKLI